MKTHAIAQLFEVVSDKLPSEDRTVVAEFARFLRSETDQTAAAFMRVRNKIARYPAELKSAYDWLTQLMEAAEAKKSLQVALSQFAPLFSGAPGAGPDDFFAALREKKAQAKASRSAVADLVLARRLSDLVGAAAGNRAARDSVMAELEDTKRVNTPTLYAVADILFKDGRKYRGRKTVISRIEAWIETGEQVLSTDKALKSVGV